MIDLIRKRDVQSDAIEVARVFLVIGLVCLHYFSFPNESVPPTYGFDPTRHQVATFVNSFVQFFFFSSVPLLSAISGWLFFGNITEKVMFRRMRGKVQSLLLPLISWNMLYVLIAFTWFTLQPDSPILHEIGGADFAHPRISNLFNAVIGITRLPIGIQFWFIHDLFVSTMMGPLLLFALRRAPILAAVLLGGVWLFGGTLGIFFRTDVLFFFYLGGLIRFRGLERPLVTWDATKLLMGAYLVIIALRVLAPAFVEETLWLDIVTRLMRFLGVIVCWGLCLHFAAGPLGPRLARYGGFAFFLHAVHYPLIVVFKQILWRQLPTETDAWMLAQYGAAIVLTIGTAVAAGAALFQISPQLYSFLAGGRSFYQNNGRATVNVVGSKAFRRA